MGKAQVKKKTDASRRHNPIRVPDAHLGGGRAEGKNPAKERQMLPILDKVSLPRVFLAGGCLPHGFSLEMNLNKLCSVHRADSSFVPRKPATDPGRARRCAT